MIENICFIRQILAYLIIPLMLITIVWFFILRNSKNKKNANLSLFIMLSVGLMVFILNLTIENKIREEIKLKLNGKDVQKILINNKLTDIELNILVKELSSIEKKNVQRGSIKTNKFKIDVISDSLKYSFKLYRNSNETTKYQVKTDKYDYELDVGMIQTIIFDKMK